MLLLYPGVARTERTSYLCEWFGIIWYYATRFPGRPTDLLGRSNFTDELASDCEIEATPGMILIGRYCEHIRDLNDACNILDIHSLGIHEWFGCLHSVSLILDIFLRSSGCLIHVKQLDRCRPVYSIDSILYSHVPASLHRTSWIWSLETTEYALACARAVGIAASMPLPLHRIWVAGCPTTIQA